MVHSTRRFVLSLALCYFVLVFCRPFSTAIISLGEERANLSAFRTFVRFVLVWFCLFLLPFGVWEGLRFMILALPGLFSYLFRNGTELNPNQSVRYSWTSVARTPMARLPWLIRIHFWVPTKFFFRSLQKHFLGEIFFFHHDIVCCVHSLESSHRGDSNEYTQHTIIV